MTNYFGRLAGPIALKPQIVNHKKQIRSVSSLFRRTYKQETDEMFTDNRYIDLNRSRAARRFSIF
jgi:hypothetical protein